MTGYLVAFATTGDPNGGARPSWPKCPPGSGKYFELGRDVIENRDLRKGEVGRPRSGSREVTVQSGHGVDRLRRQRDMRAVGSAVRLDFAAIVNGRRRITRFSCFNRS